MNSIWRVSNLVVQEMCLLAEVLGKSNRAYVGNSRGNPTRTVFLVYSGRIRSMWTVLPVVRNLAKYKYLAVSIVLGVSIKFPLKVNLVSTTRLCFSFSRAKRALYAVGKSELGFKRYLMLARASGLGWGRLVCFQICIRPPLIRRWCPSSGSSESLQSLGEIPCSL